MPTADPILQGAQYLAQDDLAAAERSAQAAMTHNPAEALHLLALVRIRQERLDEAVALLHRALEARPGHAPVQSNLGRLLAQMNRDPEALAVLQSAVEADPKLADAWFELGDVQQRLGSLTDAEISLGKALTLAPGHAFARLALGAVLKDLGRAAEAEALLAAGLPQLRDPHLKSAYAYTMGLAQNEQGKKAAALESFSLVSRLEPANANIEITRADLMQELSRHDEAEALLRTFLQREPANPAAHAALNDLLYRQGRKDDFLKSYTKAPATTPLQLSKANLLFKTGRAEEAHAFYAAILAREPAHREAALGAAAALNEMGNHGAAMAALERAQGGQPADVMLLQLMAATALQTKDPQKAAALAEQSLTLAPAHYYGLAVLGTAWRMMGDERDEILNGYDELIQIIDLEAPEGFSSMAAFNASLNDWLGSQHPYAREPVEQSLRGGSQSLGNLFNGGHELVNLLKRRISEGLDAYIAGIKPGAQHPLRSRRSGGFRYSGSWSSRLRDCGYHINHIHPLGWISSCYYVGVPEAVRKESEKQGWIKFGEPNFDTGLSPRRIIQPVSGRLVLFPSYMWHGTIAFHDASPRTTIAFDAVPRFF